MRINNQCFTPSHLGFCAFSFCLGDVAVSDWPGTAHYPMMIFWLFGHEDEMSVYMLGANKILCSIVSILALMLFVHASLFLVSAYYESIGNRHLADWQNSGTFLTVDWEEADLALSTALAFDTHASLLLRSSRLHEWQGYLAYTQSEQLEASVPAYRKAAAFTQEYLRLVPVDALGWSRLARLNLASGDFGEEFRIAFRNAAYFGPNDEQAQLELGFVISAAWPLLLQDETLRLLAITALDATLRGPSGSQMLQDLQPLDILDEICPFLDLPTLPDSVGRACAE